jgi:hypothetical protein
MLIHGARKLKAFTDAETPPTEGVVTATRTRLDKATVPTLSVTFK